MLKVLDLSRNQLAYIPPSLCKLPNLEVLIINNNKLISLPEEIGQLERLIELVRHLSKKNIFLHEDLTLFHRMLVPMISPKYPIKSAPYPISVH